MVSSARLDIYFRVTRQGLLAVLQLNQTTDVLLIAIAALCVAMIAMLIVVVRRASRPSPGLESLEKAQERLERSVIDTAARTREELDNSARAQRLELAAAFKTLSDSDAQRRKDSEASSIAKLNALASQFQTFAQLNNERMDQFRAETASSGQATREELTNSMMAVIKQLSETITHNMGELSNGQKAQLERFSTQLDTFEKRSSERLDAVRAELAVAQKEQREVVSAAITKLEASNEQKLEAVRLTVEGKLQSLRDDNTKQLEQMRQTVDEKLHSTLEKRLGESFKQVSDRLELVHKGLGEMQTLATGVGDLKKVLTNVKARGTWGEVQLGALLEQVLSQDQYECNVATKGTGERVEFAIKLPGQDKDDQVWLPIDAKFPIEDWQRLLEAHDRGDVDAMEAAGKQLEVRIKGCAADISKKYLNPPQTTDFAILFIPIEGLFAEILRRNSLTDFIQREHRVVIAGPTTLWSILNSLQMGFRTLAIQKRSSEVWNLLAAVKTEWMKYGDVLEAVQKRLHQASDSIDKAHVRVRAVGRKLRDVQELPVAEASLLLPVDSADIDDADDDADEPESVATMALRH